MKSFRDYLGLSNSCSYDVDDVIDRADRFGFQNFCSPGGNRALKYYFSMPEVKTPLTKTEPVRICLGT